MIKIVLSILLFTVTDHAGWAENKISDDPEKNKAFDLAAAQNYIFKDGTTLCCVFFNERVCL